MIGTAGKPGKASVWRTGSAAPSNALGADGDFYLDTVAGNVYARSNGSYSNVCSVTGAAGAAGGNGLATAFVGTTDAAAAAIITNKTWTLNRLPDSLIGLNGITWADSIGMFVAVGNNRLYYSNDGINWKYSSGGSLFRGWKAVVWAPDKNLFVTIAADNGTTAKVATSSDGITWTVGTIADQGWLDVAYAQSLGLFCTINYTGSTQQVATSPDGITWTARTTPGTGQGLGGICWSPELGLFCVVCTDSGAGGTGRVLTSPDGINWTARTEADSQSNQWRDVCWSPQLRLFCAVASTGTHRVMTSPDGITWTGRTAAVAQTWKSITWAPEVGLFCAVQDSLATSNCMMTSPDGITWTACQAPLTTGWLDIAWSGQWRKFVVVNGSSPTNSQMMVSPDVGIRTPYRPDRANRQLIAHPVQGAATRITTAPSTTWSLPTYPENNIWQGLCWSSELGLFCAVSYDGTHRVMTSPDGFTWTAQTAAEANQWISVCWSPEQRQFVAVANSGTHRVMTSPDGVTWTAQTASSLLSWQDVCWSGELGIYTAVSQTGGTTQTMHSFDGVNWLGGQDANGSGNWMGVCWAAGLGMFVGVGQSGTDTGGNGGRIMTSMDGTNWAFQIESAGTTSSGWFGVCWSPEVRRLVACAWSYNNPNSFMWSNNGTDWTIASSTITGQAWRRVLWAAELGLFVAVGDGNQLATSPDGDVWSQWTLPNTNTWLNIAWSPQLGRLCGIAQSGSANTRVMVSPSIANYSPTNNQILSLNMALSYTDRAS